jgi:hypothetical protein
VPIARISRARARGDGEGTGARGLVHEGIGDDRDGIDAEGSELFEGAIGPCGEITVVNLETLLREGEPVLETVELRRRSRLARFEAIDPATLEV